MVGGRGLLVVEAWKRVGRGGGSGGRKVVMAAWRCGRREVVVAAWRGDGGEGGGEGAYASRKWFRLLKSIKHYPSFQCDFMLTMIAFSID
jgi:hypothetical protein